MSATDTLIVNVDRRDVSVSITDPAGGVWWATDEAAEQIVALPTEEAAEAEALRLMRESRETGSWNS